MLGSCSSGGNVMEKTRGPTHSTLYITAAWAVDASAVKATVSRSQSLVNGQGNGERSWQHARCSEDLWSCTCWTVKPPLFCWACLSRHDGHCQSSPDQRSEIGSDHTKLGGKIGRKKHSERKKIHLLLQKKNMFKVESHPEALVLGLSSTKLDKIKDASNWWRQLNAFPCASRWDTDSKAVSKSWTVGGVKPSSVFMSKEKTIYNA